ncbi:hypothetical protein T439DRAFT_347223 [Meredithblackwellia eburnea MCA 4105]
MMAEATISDKPNVVLQEYSPATHAEQLLVDVIRDHENERNLQSHFLMFADETFRVIGGENSGYRVTGQMGDHLGNVSTGGFDELIPYSQTKISKIEKSFGSQAVSTTPSERSSKVIPSPEVPQADTVDQPTITPLNEDRPPSHSASPSIASYCSSNVWNTNRPALWTKLTRPGRRAGREKAMVLTMVAQVKIETQYEQLDTAATKKGLVQLLLYLTAANEMGGTSLGLLAIGGRFCRLLMIGDAREEQSQVTVLIEQNEPESSNRPTPLLEFIEAEGSTLLEKLPHVLCTDQETNPLAFMKLFNFFKLSVNIAAQNLDLPVSRLPQVEKTLLEHHGFNLTPEASTTVQWSHEDQNPSAQLICRLKGQEARETGDGNNKGQKRTREEDEEAGEEKKKKTKAEERRKSDADPSNDRDCEHAAFVADNLGQHPASENTSFETEQEGQDKHCTSTSAALLPQLTSENLERLSYYNDSEPDFDGEGIAAQLPLKILICSLNQMDSILQKMN